MDPMEAAVEEVDAEFYQGNKILYQLCFIWPYTRRSFQYCGRIIYIVNFSYTIYVTFLTTYGKAFVTPINWELAMQNVFELAFISVIFLMYIQFILMDKEIKDLLEKAVLYQNSITNPEERELLYTMSRAHSPIISAIKVFVFGSFWSFWMLPALIPSILNVVLSGDHNYTKKLCTTAELTFLDPDKYFYFWFMYTFIVLTMAAIVGSSLCIASTCFISVNLKRFSLLTFSKLNKLVQNEQFVFDGPLGEYIHNEIVYLHCQHKEAIEFTEKLDEIGRKVLIILSAYILLGLSSTGCMILYAKKINNLFLLIEMVVSFECVLFFAFLFGHFGQILSDASTEVFYECGWYNFPLKTRPYILLIMQRASYPFELAAGPLAILKFNYENFTAIVHTAVSYMTVMASLI